MRATFCTLASTALYSATIAVPALSWLSLPIVSFIYKQLLNFLVGTLSKDAVLEAFFLNTAIRKSSQAHDYVDAVQAKKALPANVSKDDYAKAEQIEIQAFNNFVRFSN